MKKIIIYACILLLAVACKTKQNEESAATDKPAAESADYPYTLKDGWKNWQVGDPKNSLTVLKMLKAWETKNVPECISYFADTSEWALDRFHARIPHDSLTNFILGSYADYKDLKVRVQDWESVISADKKDEWVTVWYRQSWINTKGVADSVDLINEAKLMDGKIVYYDEYKLNFPEAKK